MSSKGSRAEKGKKGTLSAGNNFEESYNNGQQRGYGVTVNVLGAKGGNGAARLNSKARAIMGINSSSISLEENNNTNGKKDTSLGDDGNACRTVELVNYLPVYNPNEGAGSRSTLGHSNGNRGMCQSMVTLDASQLVAVAMARVESASADVSGAAGASPADYEQVSSREKSVSIAETPSANSDGTVPDDTDIASGLANSGASVASAVEGGGHACTKYLPNHHRDQDQQSCPANLPSKQQLDSGLAEARHPKTCTTTCSSPSSATSSPAIIVTRPNCRPMKAITVESYQTTSSPASTSSVNYHSTSHQNAVRSVKTIKESMESKRERKAAKILAIITGKCTERRGRRKGYSL